MLSACIRSGKTSDLLRFLIMDVGTVSISILDVISDIIVIREYYLHEHYVFFALSSCVLILSSATFTIMFIIFGIGQENQRTWSIHEIFKKRISRNRIVLSLLYVALFMVLFPFGQAYPVVMWAMQTFFPPSGRTAIPSTVQNNQGQTPMLSDGEIDHLVSTGQMTFEESIVMKRANVIRRWEENTDPLREYLKAQIAKHAPFLAETITESVPQSLIQLTGLIIIGRTNVSWLNIFSICLSLVSILSKSYMVSLSMLRSVFKFKLLLICYDVVALFYVFTVLFLAEDESTGK